MKRYFFLIQLLSALFPCLKAQSSLYEKHVFHHNDFVLPYRLMLPANFDPGKTYPLIVFLHGAGERGNDNEKQLVHGSSFFSTVANRADFPAIVLFPQCPENMYWASVDFIFDLNGKRSFSFQPQRDPTQALLATIHLIDSVINLPFADKDRVYLGGLSMGGMGTFELLYRIPDRFAAAFPVCGGGDPNTVAAWAKKVPVWIFHGAIDAVVPVELSINMFEAARKTGAQPGLTVYPDVNHNAWDYVFREKDLLPWLFSKRRNTPDNE